MKNHTDKMKGVRFLFCVLSTIGLWLCLSHPGLAQNRPPPPTGPVDLYALVVGIGAYSPAGPFDDVFGAEQSANLVAETLAARGARHVMVLASDGQDGGRLIGRSDIREAVFALKRKIRSDRARAPSILFYIFGHGVGDPDVEIFFSVPGSYNGPFDQNSGLTIIQGTITNLDIFGALTQFRIHPSMSGWDELLLPSDAMPNLQNSIESIPRLLETYGKIDRAERMGAEGAPLEGNAPVPFMVLFDNCSNQIDQNLFIDGSIILPFMQSSFRDLLNEGLAFYAAAPGESATTVDAPQPLPPGAAGVYSEGKIGPVARRLLEILRDNVGPLTMSSLVQTFERSTAYDSGSPPSWAPFSHQQSLRADVREVELIPPFGRNARGTIEHRSIVEWR
ncbi:hypothetical protein [Jiella pelagia]|uniref:Caspase domain-containing protein n=1 Tax=Jiella pelagia TaxID=2986949 RepID=A0ABY7C0M9_9HYPH|nr:hypothetical protein [Jiella pelagia]WAP68323.1 hypothetical protein OH818_23760 [Jiella pelagia]